MPRSCSSTAITVGGNGESMRLGGESECDKLEVTTSFTKPQRHLVSG